MYNESEMVTTASSMWESAVTVCIARNGCVLRGIEKGHFLIKQIKSCKAFFTNLYVLHNGTLDIV